MIIFVGGGSRSGKSRKALEIARRYGPRRGFLATAQAFDDEMAERIRLHQVERGEEFTTVEEPINLGAAVRRVEGELDVLVVDCLTLWLTNVMLSGVEVDMVAMLDGMAASALPCVLVTNEVGCGIVPENKLAREFRDRAGRLNQEAMERADEGWFMVFGAGLRLK